MTNEQLIEQIKGQEIIYTKNKPAIHYSLYGEWGGQKVTCGRFYTANVAHSGNVSKITCKHCLRVINNFKTTK